jgi:hypothetical protein
LFFTLALQNCYLQCKDDPGIQNEAEAYKVKEKKFLFFFNATRNNFFSFQPVVQQACSLAASQSATKAPLTSGAPQPPAPTPSPATTPTPSAPSQATKPTESPKKANSAANASDVITAVPLIAVVAIINFIIGQFV